MIRISDEERKQNIKELEEDIKNYPIIPFFKFEKNAKESVSVGNEDFIADVKHWLGEVSNYSANYRQIEPWDRATLGFCIEGHTIKDIFETINALVNNHKTEDFIYFQCISPEMPSEHNNYVSSSLEQLELLKKELKKPGNVIKGEFYDW